MNILVIGAGGVGSSIAAIAQRRTSSHRLVLADISLERARAVVDGLDDGGRFVAARVDASRTADIVERGPAPPGRRASSTPAIPASTRRYSPPPSRPAAPTSTWR